MVHKVHASYLPDYALHLSLVSSNNLLPAETAKVGSLPWLGIFRFEVTDIPRVFLYNMHCTGITSSDELLFPAIAAVSDVPQYFSCWWVVCVIWKIGWGKNKLLAVSFMSCVPEHNSNKDTKLKSIYDRQSDNQSVLVLRTHLPPTANISFFLKFSLDSCGSVIL
jgi:hypothetical protein